MHLVCDVQGGPVAASRIGLRCGGVRSSLPRRRNSSAPKGLSLVGKFAVKFGSALAAQTCFGLLVTARFG